MNKGLFISVESIDGVGKTTQVQMLHTKLLNEGYDVYRTKEPGDAWFGSNVGRGVRNLIFNDPTSHNMHPGVSDMLFLADHLQNAGDIEREVAAGKVVITDRYADSQFAYASTPERNCPPWTLDVYKEQFGIIPDLTFLLRARGPQIVLPTFLVPDGPQPPIVLNVKLIEDISWALERANARKGEEAGKQDGKCWNDAVAQRRIQDAYLERLKPERRTFIIDIWEDSTKQEIADLIWQVVAYRLPVKQDIEKAA